MHTIKVVDHNIVEAIAKSEAENIPILVANSQMARSALKLADALSMVIPDPVVEGDVHESS